jgi:hypothetical protein
LVAGARRLRVLLFQAWDIVTGRNAKEINAF